jgi:hypothetical protein
MVDRHARDIATGVLRQFMDGLITNEEYERKFPRNRRDPALWAIHSEMWSCYSDLREHTLTGKHTLSGEARAFFERCLLFLNTDLEFQWPLPKIGLRYVGIRLLGFGWLLDRLDKKEMSVGDIEVWPFLKKTDYEEAQTRYANPRGT